MKIKPKVNRGIISVVKIPCSCGGIGKMQEWIEEVDFGKYKRYCQIFCENGDCETQIYSGRTARESRESALYEWKYRTANKGQITK